MHTLEDFPAHSNFCELVLISTGYNDVFVHVGDHVKVQAPSGKWVSPIVTGIYLYLCRDWLRWIWSRNLRIKWFLSFAPWRYVFLHITSESECVMPKIRGDRSLGEFNHYLSCIAELLRQIKSQVSVCLVLFRSSNPSISSSKRHLWQILIAKSMPHVPKPVVHWMALARILHLSSATYSSQFQAGWVMIFLETWKIWGGSGQAPQPMGKDPKKWVRKNSILYCGKSWHLGTLVCLEIVFYVNRQRTESVGLDLVVKKIEKTIQKIPGLGPLIEKIMDTISG